MKLLKWIKNVLEHLTEEPSSPIVVEETSTTEKIIMTATTEDIVSHIRDWSIDRAADKKVSKDDARAIVAEFYEWIEPEDDELEIMSIEPDDWTDEQEIDIR